ERLAARLEAGQGKGCWQNLVCRFSTNTIEVRQHNYGEREVLGKATHCGGTEINPPKIRANRAEQLRNRSSACWRCIKKPEHGRVGISRGRLVTGFESAVFQVPT